MIKVTNPVVTGGCKHYKFNVMSWSHLVSWDRPLRSSSPILQPTLLGSLNHVHQRHIYLFWSRFIAPFHPEGSSSSSHPSRHEEEAPQGQVAGSARFLPAQGCAMPTVLANTKEYGEAHHQREKGQQGVCVCEHARGGGEGSAPCARCEGQDSTSRSIP